VTPVPDTLDSRGPKLHPILEAAGGGVLPAWARARPARLKHMARVAALLKKWAVARGETDQEITRWIAAGYLHDALRDEDHDTLRSLADPAFKDLPGKVLHGPGAAARLRREGVADEEFLHALSYHTLGSPEFEALGRALFVADFLEPGRSLRDKWRRKLRARASKNLDAVVTEVLSARIQYLLEKGRPLRPETIAFWNRMSEGQAWTSASEY